MGAAEIALLILNLVKIGGTLASAYDHAQAGQEYTAEEQSAILAAQRLSEARTDQLLTDLETGGGAGGGGGGIAQLHARPDDLGPLGG